MPPRPKASHPKPNSSAKPHASHTEHPARPCPPQGAISSRCEGGRASISTRHRAIRVSPCRRVGGGPDHRLAPEPLKSADRSRFLNSRIFFTRTGHPLRLKMLREMPVAPAAERPSYLRDDLDAPPQRRSPARDGREVVARRSPPCYCRRASPLAKVALSSARAGVGEPGRRSNLPARRSSSAPSSSPWPCAMPPERTRNAAQTEEVTHALLTEEAEAITGLSRPARRGSPRPHVALDIPPTCSASAK